MLENIWSISFLTTLIFSALGAIFWKSILNISPGGLFANWIMVVCASTIFNVVATFDPANDQKLLFVALLPLIMFGSKMFESQDEDSPVVICIASVVCFMVCTAFPFMMPHLIEVAVVDFGFVYWQVVFLISFAGVIYVCGAIYYGRLARHLLSLR